MYNVFLANNEEIYHLAALCFSELTSVSHVQRFLSEQD